MDWRKFLLRIDDIDNGKAFDWGNTSDDYGKYRDIYPKSYYNALETLGFATNGQSILDIGTGTGVILRAVYNPELALTGVDISEKQIEKAKELALHEKKEIRFYSKPAENTELQAKSFDSIIAAQCYIYFDIPCLMNEINRLLKPGGRFYVTWFVWLPLESEIAQISENLILKYNTDWKGAGFTGDYKIELNIDLYGFELENQVRYDEPISFTRESWAGRIRATRGIGAVLNEKELNSFNNEHLGLLHDIPQENFQIPHMVLINSYKRKEVHS
jgi:SAM-dependent methyltransferase